MLNYSTVSSHHMIKCPFILPSFISNLQLQSYVLKEGFSSLFLSSLENLLDIFIVSTPADNYVLSVSLLQNNSLPFNQYAYLTTHNSFAIDGEPSHTGVPRVTFTNQEDTVTQQLNVDPSLICNYFLLKFVFKRKASFSCWNSLMSRMVSEPWCWMLMTLKMMCGCATQVEGNAMT